MLTGLVPPVRSRLLSFFLGGNRPSAAPTVFLSSDACRYEAFDPRALALL